MTTIEPNGQAPQEVPAQPPTLPAEIITIPTWQQWVVIRADWEGTPHVLVRVMQPLCTFVIALDKDAAMKMGASLIQNASGLEIVQRIPDA